MPNAVLAVFALELRFGVGANDNRLCNEGMSIACSKTESGRTLN